MQCAPRTQIPRISWYTKLLIVVKDLVPVRTAVAIHSKKKLSLRTTQATRSRKIAIRSNGSGYPFEKNCYPFEWFGLCVGKNCHPPFERLGLSVYHHLMHEFSRYIFCWIAFFAFITFYYRYKFNSRLSYNIQQISRTSYVLTFRVQISNAFGSRGNTLSLSINFACSRYHHLPSLPSPFPGEQLKAITTAQIWKINWTVPCIFTTAYICYKLECTCIFCHITCATICQMRKHTTPTRPTLTSWPTLISSDYWPL